MEADWEFEIGGDAPVIEGRWVGWIDLCAHPERASEISECLVLPGLADALLKLNGSRSPVWTSKTDVFVPERIDPDEMNASAEEAVAALSCYIDVLPRRMETWADAKLADESCRNLCRQLAQRCLSYCRVDVVIRKAIVEGESGLGATVYVTACGTNAAEAKQRLSECLAVFAATLTGC